MKWLLISLAIGLAASDKLDRTYLPPPGAQFSGGNLGHHDAPLQPPHHTYSGSGPAVGGHDGSHTNFGINGEPVDFGDKIPKVPFNYYPEKVPTTTTSYAFSQTTTYPPGERYETTALPINPITGLPVRLDQANFPYAPVQGQSIQNLPGFTQNQGQVAPTYGTNIQPNFGPQGPTSGPAIYSSPNYDQSVNQPLNQYPGQNVIIPGGTTQIPGSVYQTPGQSQGQVQYPGGQSNKGQQGILPTDAPGDQRFNQFPGQNVVIPGGIVQIPGGNQGLIQYPGDQTISGQQGFITPTISLNNLQPGSNQNVPNYDGSQGKNPQGTYSGQPTNVQNIDEPQRNQGQYPTENQNLGPRGSQNLYQSGSIPTIPLTYYNDISSTTPLPGIPSSTSAYSSVQPAYRPERPQAAVDRNAVILNYENVRTPNGYSYSFDTSNGIHADESGIVDNGTKAQGSYSYTGDDGKVYSVFYTADENGFQPRGDHLPTPPPIPEAIQRVIEQAARDKAAGIFDDGSYDEAKYGDSKYQGVTHRRRPQNQDGDRLYNKQLTGMQDVQVKPVAGINDADYDDSLPQNQFQNLPVTDIRKEPAGTLPSNQVNRENNAQDISDRRVSSGDGTTFRDLGDNGMPIVEKAINQFNNYGTKKQGPSRRRPISSKGNLPITDAEANNQGILLSSKNRRPLSGDKYTGSLITDGGVKDYPETEEYEFNDNKDQDIDSGNPNFSDGTDENISNNVNNVTGTPINDNRKQKIRQRVKENRQPGTKSNNYNQNKKGRPQGIISDNIKNAAKQPIPNQQGTLQDDTGYHYQQPNSKFEQKKFPTRFNTEEVSSTVKPDRPRTEYVTGTTRRPFITPNVYNQNDGVRQSTTRRPFMTVGVTSPTDNSYTDYDDGDDYATDEDIDYDKTDSTRAPIVGVGSTSRPYQSTQTTSRPQYTPGDRRTLLTQKENISGDNDVNSGTITPGNTFESTTPMPSHGSRFGSTETPRKMKPQQGRPPKTAPDSTTAISKAVTPLEMGTSENKYQTTGPVSEYTGTNVVPGYQTTDSTYLSTPQAYSTSTYRPSQGYSSTMVVTPTSGYKQDSDTQIPFKVPGRSQPSPSETFHTGYHYEPPKSDYSGSSPRPDLGYFTPSGTSEVSPTSPAAAFQTSYQQGLSGFPSTTLVPSTPERQGTFILSQPGNTAPQPSPFGTYQGNFQNGPSTPDYSTTIVSSTPGGAVFGYPGSSGVTNTPGSFIPSVTPTQGYSSTYSPGFQTTKDTFVSGPVVDGFGRPITTEQGGSHTGFSHPDQGSIGFNFGNEQSTAYLGTYDSTKVIGEDFSGPKQTQRYDPITGYHYK